MDLGSHAGYIWAAYAFTALVMVSLVLNAVRDRHAQRRALRALGDDRR
jgi:heme exporter protein D